MTRRKQDSVSAPTPVPPSDAKVQRWVDLLAALLVRRTPATFDELRAVVPAYAEPQRSEATLLRMFERDKDELRRLGVPIETTTLEESARSAYRLATRDFYLPFLVVATSRPVRRDTPPYGYRSLGEVGIAPDELALLVDAAARVSSLGDAALAAEVDWALRKLSVDLPLPPATDGKVATEALVLPNARAQVEELDALADVLARRKRCTFTYYSIERDDTSRREVEPYGLFFLGGQWYLAARDCARDGLRNFRVSRMRDVAPNALNAQRPDFEPPADFALRDHARLQQPWELGTDDPVAVDVVFLSWTGTTRAAAHLGETIDGGDARRRRYRVRRADAFTRWLLAFGGDALPVAPASIVERFREIASQAAAVYD